MLKSKLVCLLLLVACSLFLVACSQSEGEEVSLTIKDSGYRLSMDKKTGSVVYLGKKENFLIDSNEPT